MIGFIYVITNDVNGKQYVGKTTDTVEVRYKKHLEEYKKPRCEKRPLYPAMNKYGLEHFFVKQLEECELDILNIREQYWIKELNTFHNGYNATYGGDGTQLYNYELLVEEYDKGLTGQEIAEKYNCDNDTVRKALVKAGRDTKKNANDRNICYPVIQIDKKTMINLQEFNSCSAAARYIFEHNYTKDKNLSSIQHHIMQAAKGERNTAYGFKWNLKNKLCPDGPPNKI